MKTPRLGDRVRILPTLETSRLDLANKPGIVCGVTAPSVTGVDVLGPATGDRAFQVHIDGGEQEVWLPIEALELLDHSPGLAIGIGKVNLIRGRDGQWRRFKPS